MKENRHSQTELRASGLSQRDVDLQIVVPSSFGFPVAAHPRDPDTLFLLPLHHAEICPGLRQAFAAINPLRTAVA